MSPAARSRLRTLFFGTPAFAVPSLDAMVAAGRAPVLVITQPDRPAGRGRRIRSAAVAVAAERHRLGVDKPASVRDPAFLDRLRSLAPDLAVVVAFGQIFRPELLELPRLGCINLHASLLPRWRGAAPIQAAIAAGDQQTGVTTMRMDPGLDTGPILLQETTSIGAEETHPELAARLATIGARLAISTLDGLESDELEARPQDDAAATLAPRLAKSDGRIHWRDPALRVYDRWRACQPWPGSTTALDGEGLKVVAMRRSRGTRDRAPLERAPGTIVDVAADDTLAVACGDGGAVELVSVQRPGGTAIPAAAWLRGRRGVVGDRFDLAEAGG